jgi:hypothetical protein
MALKGLLLLSTGVSVLVGQAMHKIDESRPIGGFGVTLTRVSPSSACGYDDETSMRDPSALPRALYDYSGSVLPNWVAFTITDQRR